MALTTVLGVIALVLLLWSIARRIVHRWLAEMYVDLVVEQLVDGGPTYLDDRPRRSCWLCDSGSGIHDGELCPTCHLLIAVQHPDPDRPIPHRPTQGDAS